MPLRNLRQDEELVGRPPTGGLRSLRPGEIKGDISPSRTGVVSEEFRKELRDRVESETALFQFFLEASPATIGTAFGGAFGSLFGGIGILPGAALGGLLGEFLGQELGLTPQSDVGLAISLGGPVAGRLAAPAVRLGMRGTGKAITAVAPAKAAIARKAVKEAADELSSFGARVLSKQKGIMRVPASKIYTTVRGLGVQIDPRHSRTIRALDDLEREFSKVKGFPEVNQALRTIRSVRQTLSEESISFNEIISAKQLVGLAIKKAKGAGIKERAPGAIFKAMQEDLAALAARGNTLKGAAAKLLKKADARAKLEFSVREFEEGLSQNLKFIPEEESVILNVSGLRNWLRKITDPNSKQFNKNFSEGLKDEIPGLKKTLADLDRITKTLNPAGPASLVIRQAMAGTGAVIGFKLFGEAGAVAGAIAGAGMPEVIVGILLSKPGSVVLTRAAMMGRGTINEQAWAQLGQILGQAIKPDVEDRTRTRGSLIGPPIQ